MRMQVAISWNALWSLVSSWTWHEEYDQERWRSVKYWDENQKEEFEKSLADEFSRSRRRGVPENDDQ